MMRTHRIDMVVAAMLLGLLATGCALPTALPADFSQVAQGMTKMVVDQGILSEFQSGIDGNIQNPGLESYTRITLAAGVRLVGVNGEVDLNTAGLGTQKPAGMRETLIEQLDKPISDEQRTAILAILGWNRIPAPDES